MNDLHVYDPVGKSWSNISVPKSGTVPIPRDSFGLVSTGDKLYVHGGEIGTREENIYHDHMVYVFCIFGYRTRNKQFGSSVLCLSDKMRVACDVTVSNLITPSPCSSNSLAQGFACL